MWIGGLLTAKGISGWVRIAGGVFSFLFFPPSFPSPFSSPVSRCKGRGSSEKVPVVTEKEMLPPDQQSWPPNVGVGYLVRRVAAMGRGRRASGTLPPPPPPPLWLLDAEAREET